MKNLFYTVILIQVFMISIGYTQIQIFSKKCAELPLVKKISNYQPSQLNLEEIVNQINPDDRCEDAIFGYVLAKKNTSYDILNGLANEFQFNFYQKKNFLVTSLKTATLNGFSDLAVHYLQSMQQNGIDISKNELEPNISAILQNMNSNILNQKAASIYCTHKDIVDSFSSILVVHKLQLENKSEILINIPIRNTACRIQGSLIKNKDHKTASRYPFLFQANRNLPSFIKQVFIFKTSQEFASTMLYYKLLTENGFSPSNIKASTAISSPHTEAPIKNDQDEDPHSTGLKIALPF